MREDEGWRQIPEAAPGYEVSASGGVRKWCRGGRQASFQRLDYPVAVAARPGGLCVIRSADGMSLQRSGPVMAARVFGLTRSVRVDVGPAVAASVRSRTRTRGLRLLSWLIVFAIMPPSMAFHMGLVDPAALKKRLATRAKFLPGENTKLWRSIGMTAARYMELETAQRGLCALCSKPERARHSSGGTRRLAVDHDHETGRIRGLLCARCNWDVGIYEKREREGWLRRAVAYLGRQPNV